MDALHAGVLNLFEEPDDGKAAKRKAWCMHFDGISDLVQMKNPIFENGDYTIEFWLRNFGNQINSLGGNNYMFYNYTTRIMIVQNLQIDWVTRTNPLFNDFTVDMPQDMNKGNWNHFLFRFTQAGFTKEIFINGVLRGTQHIQRSGDSGFIYCQLGAANTVSPPNPQGCYRGDMDEFRLYTRAIGNDEIQYSYNNGQGNFPLNEAGLIIYYGFEQSGRNWGSLGSQYAALPYNFTGNYFIPS